jgi:DNA-binding transcriptional MerR regulator
MGETESLYGIGAVALRLGLSPTRQLERRQVLPLPRRLASGLRLYTEGDIAVLRACLDARRSVRRSALVA